MAQPLQLDETQGADGKVRIVATRGSREPVVYDLTPNSTIVVGNSQTCGILVDEPEVGPIQCMIALHSNEPELQPWPTATGTMLNGSEVTSRTPLNNGDLIEVGNCVLKVECGKSKRANSETANGDAGAFDPPAATGTGLGGDDSTQLNRHEWESQAAEPLTDPGQAPVAASSESEEGAWGQTEHDIEPTDCEQNPTAVSQSSRDEPCPAKAEAQAGPRSFGRSEPMFKWDEDAEDDETVSILKVEIVELQSELAERDAQLEAFLAAESSDAFAPRDDMGGAESLIGRIDELLLELQESDERASLMETMLSASETANRAEKEERRQLESWVGDIEQRISENDGVREAEFGLLQNRLEQMQEERDKAELQLAASARSSSAGQEHQNLLARLREENAGLQQQVADLDSQRKSLDDRLNSVEVRNAEEAQKVVVDQAIREERAKIATSQAELARERSQLASKLADIERDSEKDGDTVKVDDRVLALREHLNEIHQQEGGRRRLTTDTDEGGGLMSRIVGLWNKLD